MKVPLVDLGPQHAETAEAALAAVGELARDGHFVLGHTVARFERTLAGLTGARHAVGVASGSDALVLALRACGVGPGDLVATTPLTFVATAEAIVRTGARPLFCDVDDDTLGLSPDSLRARIAALAPSERARLRAVLPVHLFGRVCRVNELAAVAEEHGLALVEDAAQALGARAAGRPVGGIGRAGCVSFFPTKNLGAWGDGGAVVTQDDAVAARVRRLRVHGLEGGRVVEVGMNSRLDALQAAVLEVKAARLDAWTRARVVAAERYRALLAPHEGRLLLPAHGAPGEHVFHQYAVRVRAPIARDELASRLARAGIETRAYYAVPLHREPAFAHLETPTLPHAEAASAELLALPMFYGIREAQQGAVAEAIVTALG